MKFVAIRKRLVWKGVVLLRVFFYNLFLQPKERGDGCKELTILFTFFPDESPPNFKKRYPLKEIKEGLVWKGVVLLRLFFTS